jgi:hypothetical protein
MLLDTILHRARNNSLTRSRRPKAPPTQRKARWVGHPVSFMDILRGVRGEGGPPAQAIVWENVPSVPRFRPGFARVFPPCHQLGDRGCFNIVWLSLSH